MNRRKFLQIAGSTGLIFAAGGTAGCAPTDALKPWDPAAMAYPDPVRRALSYAILTPNPHNRQPWIVDLKSDTEAVLTCDLERLLPVTDPYSRQIVIGLGCFVELFSMAAADQGYLADITWFPNGEPGDELNQHPIAHLSLTKIARLAPDPLFAYVLARHTNRNPYDTTRAIDAGVSQRLLGTASPNVSIGTAIDGQLLHDLKVLTKDALLTEIQTADAFRESIDLMRLGRAEIEANPDGISLGGGFMEAMILIGVLNRKSLADPKSRSFQIGLDMSEEAAMTSMGFVWVNTVGNDRMAQIEAGRAYMRVALQVTADGLTMQPMSQALQEYTAMEPFFRMVHDKLAAQPDDRVQMLARIGYAKAVSAAPRWPLDSRIRES